MFYNYEMSGHEMTFIYEMSVFKMSHCNVCLGGGGGFTLLKSAVNANEYPIIPAPPITAFVTIYTFWKSKQS